jgi:hypothetical protein
MNYTDIPSQELFAAADQQQPGATAAISAERAQEIRTAIDSASTIVFVDAATLQPIQVARMNWKTAKEGVDHMVRILWDGAANDELELNRWLARLSTPKQQP